MAGGIARVIRDNALYAYGYVQGRSTALPRGPSEIAAWAVTKFTGFISLPLPLLSLLAVPVYGGSSVTVNLLFFYLTWSALIWSHSPLSIEILGTSTIRLVCFIIPSLVFLGFDYLLPNFSKAVKARGAKHVPAHIDRRRMLSIIAISVGNIALSVAFQALCELLATQVFRIRSLIKVTTSVPLPWTVITDLLKGYILRGALHYALHRYLLHGKPSTCRSWHLSWQHNIDLPFSLVAAYDHPVNYIVAEWLPTMFPAYLFRWHVLTWHLFVALISIEELFVYSGYSIFPSAIVLPGMARRMDAHFDSVSKGKGVGNFGHLGLVDLIMGTTCNNENDLLDDVHEEALKHNVQERIDEAVKAAVSAMSSDRDKDAQNRK